MKQVGFTKVQLTLGDLKSFNTYLHVHTKQPVIRHETTCNSAVPSWNSSGCTKLCFYNHEAIFLLAVQFSLFMTWQRIFVYIHVYTCIQLFSLHIKLLIYIIAVCNLMELSVFSKMSFTSSIHQSVPEISAFNFVRVPRYFGVHCFFFSPFGDLRKVWWRP